MNWFGSEQQLRVITHKELSIGPVSTTSFLYYSKDCNAKPDFHQQFASYDQEYVDTKYRHQDANGRRYMLDNLTAPGAGTRGHPQYELMGVTRFWRYGKE